MDAAPLQFEHVSWSIAGRQILSEVSLLLESGRSLAISGPSGSGKSSLLSIALGLITPDAGDVVVAGEKMTGVPRKQRARMRRRSMGMVFQTGELIDEVTCFENVLIGPLLAGFSRTDAVGKAQALIDRLGLKTISEQTTFTLSGGERQRTAVARALAAEPRCLLADEPTGSLDAGSRDTVAEMLFSAAADQRCALLLVTHDLALAGLAEEHLELRDGVIATPSGTRR